MMDFIPNPNILSVSDLLQVVSPQTRLEIILAIGTGEACVCHLEAVLKLRQAYISQHLMALREAGIISARRDGRYVFYRLEKPEVLALVQQAMHLAGQSPEQFTEMHRTAAQGCNCPICAPVVEPGAEQTCSGQSA
jgi:DNA-binding transcriptional ArsR family regulator